MAAVVAAMVVLSPALTVVAALAIPPIVLVGRLIGVRVRAAQRANRTSIGRLAAHVNEDLAGVDVIRSFHKDDFFIARFRRVLRQSLSTFNRANLANTFYAPTIGLVAGAMIVLLLWAGTTGAADGFGTSVGTLAAFVLLFQRFVQPVAVLSEEWQRAQAALAGAERVFEVLATPPRQRSPSPGPARGTASDPAAPPLVVDALCFGYRPDRPVGRRRHPRRPRRMGGSRGAQRRRQVDVARAPRRAPPALGGDHRRRRCRPHGPRRREPASPCRLRPPAGPRLQRQPGPQHHPLAIHAWTATSLTASSRWSGWAR